MKEMIKRAGTAAAMTLALLMLAGLAGCSQNEFTEPGPDPPAPKNPPPAQRVEKGEGMAEAPPPPEPGDVHFVGSVVLPPTLAPKMKPGMVLFVVLLESGGPKPVPLAAKRVPDLRAGAFPLAFELCAEDSMAGGPLPQSGEIVVRLDSDGDLKTSAPEDLVAGPSPAQAGKAANFTLQEPTR